MGGLTWELTATGTLVISGEGDMPHFGGYAPWVDYRHDIKSVEIADGVTSIGNRAFDQCSIMTDISIPGSVVRIKSDAFLGCTGLESITIPPGITHIDHTTFYECIALTKVTVLSASLPVLSGTANFSAPNDTLYVPKGSVESYKADETWSRAFTNIVEWQ